jgi:putative transposase
MARLARVVVPGLPHHVTQRGNGRQQTFFSDADYACYLKLLRQNCAKAKVRCLAYVLMPNHVHLILVPKSEDGLRAALAPTHRAYAGMTHARLQRSGHFWQGRFGCVPMDGDYAVAALRYVLLNPVRAKLVIKAADWRWSSARAYVKGADDGLTDTTDFLEQFPDMRALLGEDEVLDGRMDALRKAETIGRPIGSLAFLDKLERKLKRPLKAEKRGPKPMKEEDGAERRKRGGK